jgi:hypothetical protein
MINRLKYIDWTFSSTAEFVVAGLLVIVMLVSTLA